MAQLDLSAVKDSPREKVRVSRAGWIYAGSMIWPHWSRSREAIKLRRFLGIPIVGEPLSEADARRMQRQGRLVE